MLKAKDYLKNRFLIYLLPVLIFILGVIASLNYYFLSKRAVFEEKRDHFRGDCESAFFLPIVTGLEAYVHALESVVSFYHASEYVNKEEFSIFCGELLKQPELEAMSSIQWVKKVMPSQSADGMAPYNELELLTTQQSKTSDLFISEYMQPMRAARIPVLRMLGDDLIDNSLVTGGFSVSAPMSVYSRDYGKKEVMIFYPVFEYGMPRRNISDNLALNRGFVIGVLDVEAFVTRITSRRGSDLQKSVFALFDITDPADPIQIVGSGIFNFNDIAARSPGKKRLIYTNNISFGTRNWFLYIESGMDYKVLELKGTLFILSFLMLLFGLSSFFLYGFIKRNENAKKTLNDRMADLEKSNSKLKELLDMQTKFTTTVSHELRTPLAAIKTAIDIVLNDKLAALAENQKKFLHKAKLNAERLSRLISDVLDLSKIESGKSPLRIESTNINELIRDVVDIESIVAEQSGLYLKTDLQENMPRIQSDADKLNQVLSNLIGNALKFTEKGGITVSSRADEKKNYAEICVKDTGRGISKEDISKIFEKFHQIEQGHHVKKGGTGLGLAICKEIIMMHKGKIWVESKEGKGSTFYFRIPITFNKIIKDEESSEKTILLIDDERDLVEMIQYQLEEAGYNVIPAFDGLEALEKLKKINPDLIILDINLPKMGGIELYSKICSVNGRSKYPVLIMTARVNLEDIFRDMDVDGFISKPFEIDELLATVKNVVFGRTVPTVYVFDNADSENVKNIMGLLKKERYNPICVENIEDVLKALHSKKPDFLFMEYVKQSEFGERNVIREIKDMVKPSPVIVYSYTGFNDYRKKSLSEGADMYIGKPETYNVFVKTMMDFKKKKKLK